MKYLYPKKRLSTAVLALLITGLALTLGIYACKKPTDGINLIVDTAPLSKAPVLVQFVNANQNSTTALPSSFTVSITGTGASLVQIDGGGTNFTVKGGLLPLSLIKAANPTPTNPITFNIYAVIPGFAPLSQTVTVTSNNISTLKMSLVEFASPADGTTAAVKQTALTAGVSPAITIATNTTANMPQTATISIPAGTQMMDVNGNAISATTLNSNVVQYGTAKQTSLSAYPGGFNPTNVLNINGAPINGGVHFVPAGSITIDMTADATPVSKFSKPLPVSFELQSTLTNFITGKTIAVGDTIPLWSMNQNTGQWKLEGKATVAKNTAGNLAANFTISHLTVYDLDWWFTGNGAYNTCQNKLTINLHPSTTGYFTGEQYRVQLETATGDRLLDIKDIDPRFDNLSLNVDSLPQVSSAKITVYNTDTTPWTIVGSSSSFSPCGTGSIDVNFTAPPAADIVNATFNISAKCTNKDVVAYPTGWIYFYDLTAGRTVNAYFSNGQIYNQSAPSNKTAQFINGHKYYFATTYSGTNYQSGTFILDKSNIVIPAPQAGVGFSGGAVYNATTNTIAVTAAFTLTNCN